MSPIFRLIHSFAGDEDDINKKRTSKHTSPSCVVAGSIQISNLLVKDLKAISKLKDVLDEFQSEKVLV